MQDNDGWELIGYEGTYTSSQMGKVPNWVRRKMQSMDLRHIAHAGDGKVRGFYPLQGRRYSYRICASPEQGGGYDEVYVYRKPRGHSRSTRRPRQRSGKVFASVLVIVIGAVLLVAFLARIL